MKRSEGILLALTLGAVLAHYLWSASSSANPSRFRRESRDYYNLLVDALLSLYAGRFYLYFGIAPAFTLFAPFRLLSGLRLPENLALALLLFGSVAWLEFSPSPSNLVTFGRNAYGRCTTPFSGKILAVERAYPPG